jgi:hypothetical protein
MQFRHDFSTMEKNEIKKRKEKFPSKKEILQISTNAENKEEEKWVNLNFYKKESYQSSQILEKLSCEFIEEKSEIPLMTQEDYYKLIFKNINNEAITEKINEKIYQKEKISSVQDLQKLNITEQIELLFKKTTILSFDFILNILGLNNLANEKKEFNNNNNNHNNHNYGENKYSNGNLIENKGKNKQITEEEILKLILAYSQMLNSGNFIYKSELKYDYVNDVKQKNILIRQRNTIINLLMKHKELKKKNFSGINENILTEILNESCIIKNGFYILKDEIFSKNKTEEFIIKYNKFYINEISNWETLGLDNDIKLVYIDDKDIYKNIQEIEDLKNIKKSKRKTSLNYDGLGFNSNSNINNNNKKDDDNIKIPINPQKGNNLREKDSNKSKENQNENTLKDINIINDNNVEISSLENIKEIIPQKNTKNDNNNNNNNQTNKISSELINNSLLKIYDYDGINKKSEIFEKILIEFSELKKDNSFIELVKYQINEVFYEINEILFIKNIEERDDNVWKLLLDCFSRKNSYKKTEIKKFISEGEFQITDQNLNKLLKRLANYSNSQWKLKE